MTKDRQKLTHHIMHAGSLAIGIGIYVAFWIKATVTETIDRPIRTAILQKWHVWLGLLFSAYLTT